MAGSKTIRQAARDRDPLGGPDAQALEGALALTERERDRLHKALSAIADHYDAQPEENYHYDMRLLVLEARVALAAVVYRGAK